MRALALLTMLALPAAAQTAATAVPPAAKPTVPAHRTTSAAHSTVVKPKPATRPVAHKITPKTKAAPKLVAATVTPAPFSENPIVGLRGNARALLVFASDSRLPAARRQLANLDQHTLELTQHDTVFVPEIGTRHTDDEVYPGENIPSGTTRDQLSARLQFGLKSTDFAVILLDKDGVEARRWTTPVTVSNITLAIDSNQQASLR